MRVVAEVLGALLIGASLFIGWVFIVKRWFEGPRNEKEKKDA